MMHVSPDQICAAPHREVVLKLLQFEASTNVADSKGCSALHLAAWRGDVDIVRILIHHGPSHCRVNQQVKVMTSV